MKTIASSTFMERVRGRSRISVLAALNPGTAPTMVPRTTAGMMMYHQLKAVPTRSYKRLKSQPICFCPLSEDPRQGGLDRPVRKAGVEYDDESHVPRGGDG